MTPETVMEAVRLLRLLDRSEELLAEIRKRPLEGVCDIYLPGDSRFDRIQVSALAAEVEATGVSLNAMDDLVRDYLDARIDAQAVLLRAWLAELGVELPVRPVPTARVEALEP